MAWLKSEIKKQFLKESNAMYMNNSRYIASLLDTNKVLNINSKNTKKGEFYFILYNLAGKISKMEQIIPCIYLGEIDTLEGKKSLCFSFNFLPVAIRTIFIDKLLEKYDKNIIKTNLLETSISNEKNYSDLDFNYIYKALKTIGFEYAVREILTDKINKIFKISTKDLVKFITMNTYLFTNVPEDKLAQIWVSKLKDKDEREKEFLKKLICDFEKMTSEIQKSISEQKENISNNIDYIKNLKYK